MPKARSKKRTSRARGQPKPQGSGKFYAVARGEEPGIYTSWEECLEQVEGYSRNRYKSFETLKEAEDYMEFMASRISQPRSAPSSSLSQRSTAWPYTTRREKSTEGPTLDSSTYAIVEKLKTMEIGDMMSITRSYRGFNHDVLVAARFTPSLSNVSGSSAKSSSRSTISSSPASRPTIGRRPAAISARGRESSKITTQAMEDEEDDPFADSEDNDIMGGDEYNEPDMVYEQHHGHDDWLDEWDF